MVSPYRRCFKQDNSCYPVKLTPTLALALTLSKSFLKLFFANVIATESKKILDNSMIVGIDL